MVDLSLSAEEIQELMLTQLLPSVYKQQLIQHLQLQNDKQLLQDKLGSEMVRGPAIFYNHIKKCLAVRLSSYIISWCGVNAVSLSPPTSLSVTAVVYLNCISALSVLIWLVSFRVRNYGQITFCLYSSSKAGFETCVVVRILCN